MNQNPSREEGIDLVIQLLDSHSNEWLNTDCSLELLRYMHWLLDPKCQLSQHKSIEIYCLRELRKQYSNLN